MNNNEKILNAIDTVRLICAENTLGNERICGNCPVRKLSITLENL